MIQEANLHWRYVDTDSNLVMPWYAIGCLEWIKSLDTKEWTVFEYGAGYSTIWWRLNAGLVDSVDHDERWAWAMTARHETKKAKYIASITSREAGSLDCVVVDGEWRDECAHAAVDFVAPGGHLIFDNYGQKDFPSTRPIDELLKTWTRHVFFQPNHSDWKTAVFTKPPLA